MSTCPRCDSERIVNGKIGGEVAETPIFRPASLRGLSFTLSGGVHLASPATACRDCGFVAAQVDQAKLDRFVEKHCRQSPPPLA